jgi:hypothetical protein
MRHQGLIAAITMFHLVDSVATGASVPVTGAVRSVSSADIQEATSAVVKGLWKPKTIYSVRVIKYREIRLYMDPEREKGSYYIAKRTRRGWWIDEVYLVVHTPKKT